MTSLKILLALTILAPGIGTCGTQSDQIPAGAKQAISAVHVAALKHDFPALRRLMVQEFVWSFGGDSVADQAIRAWQESPSDLKEIARVTGLACSYVDAQHIQCPPDAGMDYRAGFIKTKNGWRMDYFVSGD